MEKVIIVAVSPDGEKVTTISTRLGEKGVPYGWRYIFANREELPHDKHLNDSWLDLSRGKKVHTSVFNKDETSLSKVEYKNRLAIRHLGNIDKQRKEILRDLDVSYIRSLEKPFRLKERKAILKFKNDLRDLDVDLKDFEDVEEALDYRPDVLNFELDTYRQNTYLISNVQLVILTLTLLATTLIALNFYF